jgi:hypothetical protein
VCIIKLVKIFYWAIAMRWGREAADAAFLGDGMLESWRCHGGVIIIH